MTEIVERVARAIAQENIGVPYASVGDLHRRLARAALQALEEPTEAMVIAAGREHFTDSAVTYETAPQGTRDVIVDGVDRVWRAMIRAAQEE